MQPGKIWDAMMVLKLWYKYLGGPWSALVVLNNLSVIISKVNCPFVKNNTPDFSRLQYIHHVFFTEFQQKQGRKKDTQNRMN